MRFLLRVPALFAVPLMLFLACRSNNTDPYSEAHFAMGTVCTITLYETVEGFEFQEAFDLIDEIEWKMSVQIADSEVSAVNKAAGKEPVNVSEDTLYVIRESLAFAEEGSGAFDITVQPLVALWGIGTEAARVPEEQEIQAALSLVDYTKVTVDVNSSTVFLADEGMALDLGGIAKGYASDEVKEFLLERGFTRGIINFGGNVIAFGTKVSEEPWKIGIQDPFDSRGNQIGIVETAETSIVTSGIYERYFERDSITYHHILDTAAGYPVDNSLASVTIVTEDCIAADAYSTLVFALGLDEGMRFIEDSPDVEAVFVTKDKSVYLSSGLKESFVLKNTEYSIKDDTRL